MTPTKIHWTPSALQDLERIRIYLAENAGIEIMLSEAQRHQMKAFIDSGSYEIVSLEERAEIEADEAEKKAEEQAKLQAEADARPLYKDARGVQVYAK